MLLLTSVVRHVQMTFTYKSADEGCFRRPISAVLPFSDIEVGHSLPPIMITIFIVIVSLLGVVC